MQKSWWLKNFTLLGCCCQRPRWRDQRLATRQAVTCTKERRSSFRIIDFLFDAKLYWCRLCTSIWRKNSHIFKVTLFSMNPSIWRIFSLSWSNIKNVLRVSIVKIESPFWAGRHLMKTRKPSASILEIFLKISIILTELVENYLLWNKSWKYLEMISTTFS